MAPAKSSAKKSTSSGDKESGSTKTTKTKAPVIKEFIIRPSNAGGYLEKYTNYPNAQVSEETLENLELKKGAFVKVSIGLKELNLIVDVAEGIDNDIVLINPYYLDLYGVVLGERATLGKVNTALNYAKSIEIDILNSGDITLENLVDVGIVYPGLNCGSWYIKSINDDLSEKLEKLDINGNNNFNDSNSLTGHLIHPKNTKITFNIVKSLPEVYKRFSFNEIGGLEKTLVDLKKTVKIPLENTKLFRSFGIEPPKGILLYGNSGVGKTMILKSLPYEFRGCHIVKIDGSSIISKYLGDSEEKVRSSFKEAIKYQPSIILIDEIDSILPNRKNKEDVSDVDGRIINTFNSMMDELNGNGQVVVVGATNEINNIDMSLRRPGRFDIEVEIGIPDVDGRYDILQKQVNKIQNDLKKVTQNELRDVASKTHGYVGSDLFSLVRESVMKAINRYLENQDGGVIGVEMKDFEESMKEIRPSAMKEIILEMPKVKWTDIGGQEELKRKLHEMVELPLKEADRFKKFGIKAPKGLLLYGPPGCSKTMTAKALATESGLNFFAIKGPEIFDKYVGESERKIRDIFSKARTSSPSIIFIDEIDAIAIDRESGEASNVSKQVLNTMLNELDGVEELNGVILVGATNRPASIDAALLRPGRLDRHVYVGPPDALARREIFLKNTEKFGLSDELLETAISELVEKTDGCSGSECVLLCQEAGLAAVSAGEESVKAEHFERALSTLVRNIDDEMLAYYEAFAGRT